MEPNRARKIVRDKIPALLDAATRQKNPTFYSLDEINPAEQLKLIVEKLEEEVEEVCYLFRKGGRIVIGKLLEEIADVTAVLDLIRKRMNLTVDDVNKAAVKKLDRNGGFTVPVVMEYDEIQDFEEKI